MALVDGVTFTQWAILRADKIITVCNGHIIFQRFAKLSDIRALQVKTIYHLPLTSYLLLITKSLITITTTLLVSQSLRWIAHSSFDCLRAYCYQRYENCSNRGNNVY